MGSSLNQRIGSFQLHPTLCRHRLAAKGQIAQRCTYQRESHGISGPPEAERPAWTKLWADVEQLRKQIRGLTTETAFQGKLTDMVPEQVHEMKFEAGKAYIIDMKSMELKYVSILAAAAEWPNRRRGP
jgi:hypothetical protein